MLSGRKEARHIEQEERGKKTLMGPNRPINLLNTSRPQKAPHYSIKPLYDQEGRNGV